MLIRFRIALLTLLLPCCALSAEAQVPDVPDLEYATDLSELKKLRRVFVYSAPDPLARFAIVEELNRHPELLEVVETPEQADYYIVFYGLAGGDVVDARDFSGEGGTVVSGTLVAFRQVKTCAGSRRRLIFVTRKTKTFHRFTLPTGGLPPSASGLRQPAAKGAAAELIVRLGLTLIQRKRGDFLSYNMFTNSGVISFSRKAEVGAAKKFVKELKKVYERRSSAAPTLLGAVPGAQKVEFVKPNPCSGRVGPGVPAVSTPPHKSHSGGGPRRALNKRPVHAKSL